MESGTILAIGIVCIALCYITNKICDLWKTLDTNNHNKNTKGEK